MNKIRLIGGLRQRFAAVLELLVEIVGLIGAFAGTAVALFLGKLFAAAVLAGVTTGIVLRIAGRRGLPRTSVAPPSPAWRALCAALSLVETALLVEASNLPVRVTQPGFEKSNWLLVIAALIVLYVLQMRLLGAFRSHRLARHRA